MIFCEEESPVSYKSLRSVVVGGLLTVTILATQVASGGSLDGKHEPDVSHYPDLRTRQLQPTDLKVHKQQSRNPKFPSTKVELRFPNTVADWGTGPLELRPEHDTNANTTTAYQRLYSHDSAGNPYLVAEHRVGTFVFHQQHRHWHFEGFALYELFYDADGTPGEPVIAGAKTTVCIRDNSNPEDGTSTLAHFGWGGYRDCNKNSNQGLTVGYGDTYTADTEGQSFDISNVSLPACLWLRSTADPYNLLHESPGKLDANGQETNNAMDVRFYVTSDNDKATACPSTG